MKPKKRQKMCYHCEGGVDLDVIVCPFCAADLRAEKTESRTSVYPPHYVPKSEETPAPATTAEEPKSVVGPTLLVALGSQLLLLGLLQLLFSHKGALLLKWDARLWFIYILASIPFLIFGYRSAAKL